MKRIAIHLCVVLVLAGGLFWLFPLFHVVRIDEVEPRNSESRIQRGRIRQIVLE